MNTNQYHLLHELLKRPTYVKSSTLADALSVSTRSIHTYVTQINDIVDDELITSSNKGYFLSRHLYKKYENKLTLGIPQDNYSRAIYLIEEILRASNLSISSFDFIEDIHISFSTLGSVLTEANTMLEKKKLKISSKSNQLKIVGDYENVRTMKKDIILDEASNNQINIALLNGVFGENRVDKTLTFLDDYTNFIGSKIVDFSLLNIVLHICIILTTVSSREVANGNSHKDFSKSEKFVYDYINNKFNQSLSLKDVQSIMNTIYGFSDFRTKENIENKYPDSSKIIKGITKFVDEFYGISLENQEFISAFNVHINNLIARIHENRKAHNPIVEHIKDSTPYIYDVATNIGLYINQFFNQSVMTEDEVGFIALHLGAEIQRQNKMQNLIQTLLIIPDYIETKTKLSELIAKDFSDSIMIVDVSTNKEYLDVDLSNYELIVSALTHIADINLGDDIINISPFYTNDDKINLLEKINSLELQDSNLLLNNSFDDFFDEDLFFIINNDENTFEDKYSLINEMSAILEKEKYVGDGYSSLISEREILGSTRFNKIAVPHQTMISANKTGICTYFFPEGFQWDDEYVYFVFLIAITKKDRAIFQKIYESLLYTFEHSNVFTHLDTIEDFSSFRYHLLSMLSN